MYLYQLDTPTCMMAQALLQFLRIWLSLVGFIAVFSGLQAVFGFSVLENRVYTVERACCCEIGFEVEWRRLHAFALLKGMI
eukprot:m.192130 g.192130  ORF g.192130 m.192130 type:complete len:81 (+) comp39465_c0_seq5:63-305(+)